MKVTLSPNKTLARLATLEGGQTFLYKGTAYMRTEPSDSFNINAVKLWCGSLAFLSPEFYVEPVELVAVQK